MPATAGRRPQVPDLPRRHNNLGNALKELGNLGDAIACHHRALELDPNYAEAYYNLGNALKAQGEPDEAVGCYRRALELKADYALAHDNLLYALQYCAGVTPAALAEAHAEYERPHARSGERTRRRVLATATRRSAWASFRRTSGVIRSAISSSAS